MARFVNLAGRKFGRLLVLRQSPYKKRGKILWICKCDCGNTAEVISEYLKSGHTRSCGCLSTKHGYARKERLYGIWVGMKQRCRDENSKDYSKYGGRGISVCSEWIDDYLAFRDWALSNGYNDTLSIDRIHNDGNYCPNNCRWVTLKVQNNNTSRNTYATYGNQTHTLSAWAEILNIPYKLMMSRLHNGWSFERIVARERLEEFHGST